MECKNCEKSLFADYNYCANCGAKVIRNRITIKNIWNDFTERFLNIDNTFLRTFVHLFSKPEAVIGGYIRGVRRKYLNPISYFTIAVTLGGLFIFVYRKFFPDALDFQQQSLNAKPEANALAQDISSTIFEYQSLFYIATLPLLALISRLVFINSKKFNLSEHFVINVYGYSHLSILVNALYLATIWNTPAFQVVTFFNMFFQIAYFTYIFKRLFGLTIPQTLLKLLIFLGILLVLFIALVIAMAAYMVVNKQ
ncbi:DUF3667 domain-containing protein [Flavobacteriaceae bacterium TP-CH-4]|uniref:DUF3667 domain-containing protein n=1 Tax=Pelagihabitans pacificus TaxID=2696054 RepID=A0A967APN8_9FLAO|nr:DUF3667 domain-containing protein [Pelagihabitans pacificus]NHF57954.1 DUF3667 domain-containing protein [Pelagihabitans pacificus]